MCACTGPAVGTVSDEAYRPPPPFVHGPEDERRWGMCVAIAEATVVEGGGLTLAQARWHESRTLYRSDLPTGDAADPPARRR